MVYEMIGFFMFFVLLAMGELFLSNLNRPVVRRLHVRLFVANSRLFHGVIVLVRPDRHR